MKRIISAILILVMLCGMLPMTMAATEYTSGNYTYTLDTDGNATIIKYNGSEANLTIPSTLDGHPVTSIDYNAAKENKYIVNLTLPSGLTFIGSRAFGSISSLRSVFIPKSLDYCAADYTSIAGAFADSNNLNIVTFENGTTQIPANLFNSCNGLTEITIPDTVTTIERSAFRECQKLENVIFSKNLTSIGVSAFEDCISLSAIDLPKYVTSIDSSAFKACALTDVVLPSSLKFIGSRAFGNNPSLKSVFIPKSLDYCASDYSTYEGAFAGSDNLNNVTFETGVTQIARNLFNSCDGLNEITIPETVALIEANAFRDCENLAKVTMSDCVITIEGYAFSGCSKLQEIKLPANLTKIGTGCFKACSSLTEMVIPETVADIANNTFADCTALETINMGKVTKIDYSAFENCDSLTSVTIPGSVTSIGSEIFAYCDNLSEVNLSVNLTKIPNNAFFECPALQKIILPFNVKEIENNAFANCTGLTEITIPRYTTTIANNAFSYPGMLTIYGVAGTRAESYASEIGATFVAIDKATTSLTFNRSSLILNKGETFRLIPEIAPMDFTGEVKWETSDQSVATIDAYGLVKAVKNGSAVITFTAGNMSVSCTVTVGEHTHSYTETVITEPTCTTAGKKELVCSCGDVKTETIAALGHNFVDGVCTRCGEVDNTHTHVYTETVIVEPTCTTPGQKQLVCTCGDVKTESIALLGHSYVDGICSRCGAEVSELTFTDIVEGTWYYDGVIFAIENGLMNGMGNNKFEPEIEMTRAMLVTVLWRYAGSNIEGTNIFTDVPSGQWYTEAILWAAHNGLVLGVGNNRFDPNGVIDRQQLVTLLYRYAAFLGIDTTARADLSHFPDANKVANWAKDAVSWAVAEGLLYGTTVNGVPHLDPNGSAVRCQVATFFMRFIQNLVEA